jgi:hypothetical protein
MAKASGKQISKGGKLIPKSSTPGKKKGDTCQADWRKKYYLSSPKAYKDAGYTAYHEWALNINGAKR